MRCKHTLLNHKRRAHAVEHTMTIHKNLSMMLSEMELRALDALQLQAVSELRDELDEQAKRQPCLRCAHAGWITTWNDDPAPEKRRFYTRLASCSAFQALPRSEDEFGLQIPLHFFCTSASSGQEG